MDANRDFATRWRRRWEEGGFEALRDRRGSGANLKARIERLLAEDPLPPWDPEDLALELGVSGPALERALKALGLELSHVPSWSFDADTGVDTRTSCLVGLFLSKSERCIAVASADRPLTPEQGTFVTRSQALAGALSSGNSLTLSDALWTAADLAMESDEVRPKTLKWFLKQVATSLPREGVTCHAVVLSAADEGLSLSGAVARALSVVEVCAQKDWDACCEALLLQLSGGAREQAARLVDAVQDFCESCVPSTDPVIWNRGVSLAFGNPLGITDVPIVSTAAADEVPKEPAPT